MSQKVKDDKNRWRNKIVAFRVSPEEWVELDKRWRLLGYRTKQDYLIQSVLKSSVTAVGNMQMIYQFKQSLREILTERKRIEKAGDMDEELMTPVRTMLEIMEAANNQTVAEKERSKIPEFQYEKMMHLTRLREMLKKEMEGEKNE